jgi:hypothetical protein
MSNNASIHDDTRDALAMLRACFDGDVEGAYAIGDNCDLMGVLAIICGITAGALIEARGEDGARAWLDRQQRRR